MPLLPLEPFLFPDDLFRRPAGLPDGLCWWVLHTRPRAEKSLARRFMRRGTAFFLPLAKQQWRSRSRLFRSYVPLFPGYVFLHGDSQARLQALETNLVARFLQVEDQPQLHGDLARIYHLMVAGVPLTPEDRLTPGTVVEIARGPLAGLEGKVIQRRKGLKFLVEVKFLQRGASVEIEGWMLERCQQRPLALAVGT